jgi:hypothetical protein
MSRNGKAGPAPAGGWLEGDQWRAWLAYIRVQLRLAYEMNRQLLADSGMSLLWRTRRPGTSISSGGCSSRDCRTAWWGRSTRRITGIR